MLFWKYSVFGVAFAIGCKIGYQYCTQRPFQRLDYPLYDRPGVSQPGDDYFNDTKDGPHVKKP